MSLPRFARGLTLVETMVAMTIGLIVLTVVAQVFATSRSTYRFTDALSRVQESARVAVQLLARDARMAGYLGCLPKTASVNNLLNNPADYATDLVLGQHINGHAYTGTGSAIADWSPALPAAYFAAAEAVPNSDLLVIRRSSDWSANVVPPYMPTASAALQIAPGNGLIVDDVVLVSDCKNADLFQITGPTDPNITGTLNHNTGTSQPGNANQALSKTYEGDAEIFKLITRVYYVGRRNNNPNNPPALFIKDLDGGALVAQELIEGVDSMQALYGEDTDGDGTADVYSEADLVTDWNTVVSIRVAFLLRTIDNVDVEIDTRTYTVAGTNIGPFNDRRQRRVFTSTIQLRN